MPASDSLRGKTYKHSCSWCTSQSVAADKITDSLVVFPLGIVSVGEHFTFTENEAAILNAALLARILEEGHVKKPGMVNSVNEEGTKCETIFPIIAGTPWEVVGLTCDQDGIPADPKKKVEIAKRIIDKADKYGVALKQLHIDPCVMALATMPTAMDDFAYCIENIHAYAPEAKVTGAISNISFDMPARKYVNMNCMAYAIAAIRAAGLDDVKVIVGGCPVSADAAAAMGADEWAYSPQKTVKVCTAWAEQ